MKIVGGDKVNIGFWICSILGVLFLIMSVLFAVLKEKGAQLISGFNTLSKEEQDLYDKTRISKDMQHQCFIWAMIMFIGALLSYLITSYMAIPVCIVWMIMFFKEVHFDVDKAFEKYLLKP